MSEQTRREALKRLRAELVSSARRLLVTTERLVRAHDVTALRAHADRLWQHADDLAAYTVALERFLNEFGPPGDG